MEALIQSFYTKYARTQTQLKRSFVDRVNWENRFIGIKGSRGVGKTTLILQHIKENYQADGTVLYVSLDSIHFASKNLYHFADQFYKKGGVLLALDEVHKYPNWAKELKNIYDDMPNLKVVFTGSSLLHLREAKADLSRRVVMYHMPGLSLREYIHFEINMMLPKYTLDELLQDHVSISMSIAEKIKPLAYFDRYLKHGYYPFFKESLESFHSKLNEIILTSLEVDIPQFSLIQTSNIIYLKKLLGIISQSVPFKPNMKSLSERNGISLNTMKHYIKLLHDADLLQLLYVPTKGINSLNKPEKVYLNNTNLMYNHSQQANIGNIRETFLFNQLEQITSVHASKEADFLVDSKFTFEVGGSSKKKKQIDGILNSYIIKDDIEIGSSQTIPLWLFGFLY